MVEGEKYYNHVSAKIEILGNKSLDINAKCNYPESFPCCSIGRVHISNVNIEKDDSHD